MAKGIVLLFDAESTRAIRRCRRQLEAAGIPSLESFTHRRHEPHVSLVVADEIAGGGWMDALQAGFFPADPMRVEFGPAGGFPGGWLYLGVNGLPAANHAELIATLGGDAAGVWEHYLPEHWVPHCTLAGDLSDQQVTAAMDVIGSSPLPGIATIMSAALVDSVTGDLRRLHEHAAATAST
jgi:2'-5' RNA ligase